MEVQPDAAAKRYRFSDVQGVDEAKLELQEIVEFLKNPNKFTRLGGKLPKGNDLLKYVRYITKLPGSRCSYVALN